jgi:hypothetical protein
MPRHRCIAPGVTLITHRAYAMRLDRWVDVLRAQISIRVRDGTASTWDLPVSPLEDLIPSPYGVMLSAEQQVALDMRLTHLPQPLLITPCHASHPVP